MLGEHHELKNRYLHISYRTEKPDIESEKPDIGAQKPDIHVFPYASKLEAAGYSVKTSAHAKRLFQAFGYKTVFGRNDAVILLGLSASSASDLLKKLLDAGIIEKVTGMGKGKYRFQIK